MDAINLLQSRDFSYETLDFIDNFFQKNLSGGLENNFRELLFELFEGKGLNTKTKKRKRTFTRSTCGKSYCNKANHF